jgi:hypothetical protein
MHCGAISADALEATTGMERYTLMRNDCAKRRAHV